MPKRATNRPKTLGTIHKIDLPTSLYQAPNPWTRANVKKAFLKHYTQTPTYGIFQRFKLGAMLFFLGLVIIYGGYQLLEHSLAQEITVLIGLCFIGVGFLMAMLAQVRLLIGRLIHILFHKHRM